MKALILSDQNVDDAIGKRAENVRVREIVVVAYLAEFFSQRRLISPAIFDPGIFRGLRKRNGSARSIGVPFDVSKRGIMDVRDVALSL